MLLTSSGETSHARVASVYVVRRNVISRSIYGNPDRIHELYTLPMNSTQATKFQNRSRTTFCSYPEAILPRHSPRPPPLLLVQIFIEEIEYHYPHSSCTPPPPPPPHRRTGNLIRCQTRCPRRRRRCLVVVVEVSSTLVASSRRSVFCCSS